MDESEARLWTAQSRMSDPGPHREAVSGLPDDVAGLVLVVQGLLIHGSELDAYGVPPGCDAPRRTTLPVADRLGEILADDARPLDVAREPAARAIGTCRDFALLLCGLLRGRGVPARVRCGFADYFAAMWHDHWVCEYRDAAQAAWRIADPQMDGVLRAKYGVDFDPVDVPRSRFRTAGEAWAHWRAGRADPDRYGHGTTTGPWFLKVDVVRDHLALRGHEVSAWDGWRDAPAGLRRVAPNGIEHLDRLAAEPGLPSPVAPAVPPWCDAAQGLPARRDG